MNLAETLQAAVGYSYSSQLGETAACTINGETIPCDQMPDIFFTLLWIIPIVTGVIAIASFTFSILMFIDAIKHQNENKIMWVFTIMFLNIVGALIYYFAEKRNRKTEENPNETQMPS
jgi:cytochrome c-type biogenesis protein CcmH/NrfF